MAKKPPKTKTRTQEIIAVINSDQRQDMIILLIPSHDKNHRELQNQEIWAAEAMELFGDLYGRATAFKALQGIYKDEDGNIHRDTPILIESYVKRVKLVDEEILNRLLAFSQRMGRETRQKAVALIINDVFHEITDL